MQNSWCWFILIFVPAAVVLSDVCSDCECSASFSTVTCAHHQGEIVLRSLPESLAFLRIFHCDRVVVTSRALATLRSLRTVEFSQINELVIHEQGLVWEPHRHVNHTIHTLGGGPIVGQYEEVYGGPGTLPAVSVSLESIANVPQLPRFAFGGHVEHIAITDTTIGTIQSYAFTNLRGKIDKILIENCRIGTIDALAFKRIHVETVSVVNTSIAKIQSRSFFETRVKKEFSLQRVFAGEVSSAAFSISGPLKTSIVSCRFAHVSGEAFQVSSAGPVLVAGNAFDLMDSGALLGFRPMDQQDIARDSFLYDPEAHESPHTEPSLLHVNTRPAHFKITRLDFYFRNNSIRQFAKGALRINKNFSVTFERVILRDGECDCQDHAVMDLMGLSPEEFPERDTSSLYTTIWCRFRDLYVRLANFKEEQCSPSSVRAHVVFVALGVAGGLCLLLAGVAVLFWCGGQKKRVVVVVRPDKRTYKETVCCTETLT